jgi:hypothetical protein
MTATVPIQLSSASSASIGIDSIGDKLQQGSRYALDTSKKIIDAAAAVVNDVEGFQKVVQIGALTASAIELGKGPALGTINTQTSLNAANDVVEMTRILPDANYFISGNAAADWKSDREVKAAGMGAFVVADVCETASWLDSVGIVSLSKVSNSLGVNKVFSRVSFNLFGLLAAVIGLGLLVVDSAKQAVKETNPVGSMIKVASYTAKFVKCSLSLFGRQTPIAYVTLGLIGSGLGLSSFLYNHINNV